MSGKESKMSKDAIQAVVQATPPTAVTGLTLCGIGLSDWVLIATLVYTVFLIINNAMTFWQKVKEWCSGSSRKE